MLAALTADAAELGSAEGFFDGQDAAGVDADHADVQGGGQRITRPTSHKLERVVCQFLLVGCERGEQKEGEVWG